MQMHETAGPVARATGPVFLCSTAPALSDDVVFEFDEDVPAGDALVTAGEDQEDITAAFLGLFVAVFPQFVSRFDLALFRGISQRCNDPRLTGFSRLDLGERALADVFAFAL